MAKDKEAQIIDGSGWMRLDYRSALINCDAHQSRHRM